MHSSPSRDDVVADVEVASHFRLRHVVFGAICSLGSSASDSGSKGVFSGTSCGIGWGAFTGIRAPSGTGTGLGAGVDSLFSA